MTGQATLILSRALDNLFAANLAVFACVNKTVSSAYICKPIP